MSSFFRKHFANRERPLSVSVEIPLAVIDRIKKAVLRSDVEVGGKFLGRIKREHDGVHIRIDTFLDSGPGVSCSASHIIPDAEYQEALFRVVESFDPEIDHVGSWHSHHCNELSQLSPGDIRNYSESVNDPRYNNDFFFVMLIVEARNNDIGTRFYLFVRGADKYIEVREGDIRRVCRAYPLEPLLEQAERASTLNQAPNRQALVPVRPAQRASGEGTRMAPLREIRAEDNRWFKAKFPSARTVLHPKTKSTIWICSETVGGQTLTMRYEHPAGTSDALLGQVVILCNDEVLVSKKIQLNASRFEVLEKQFRYAQRRIHSSIQEKDHERPSSGQTETNPFV